MGYVAGPFRGANAWEVEQNIRRAESLAFALWQIPGIAVICPHANTRYFDKSLPDHVWLVGDLEILRRCDFVVLTADWQRSHGARTEANEAHRLGIPVFESAAAVSRWLATGETA